MNVVTGFLNQMNSYMPYAYGAAGIALLVALFYFLSGLLSFGRLLKGYRKEISSVSAKGKHAAETFEAEKQMLRKKFGGLGKVIAVFALARVILKDYQREKNDQNVPKASLVRSASKAVRTTDYIRKVLH